MKHIWHIWVVIRSLHESMNVWHEFLGEHKLLTTSAFMMGCCPVLLLTGLRYCCCYFTTTIFPLLYCCGLSSSWYTPLARNKICFLLTLIFQFAGIFQYFYLHYITLMPWHWNLRIRNMQFDAQNAKCHALYLLLCNHNLNSSLLHITRGI